MVHCDCLFEMSDSLQSVTEKLMLMGWVLSTAKKDTGVGDNAFVLMGFSTEGKIKLTTNPMYRIIQEVEASQGPLSGEEKQALLGIPMLANQNLQKPEEPPPNPRFHT